MNVTSDPAAGVRLTAPAVPGVELRSVIAEALGAAAPELTPERCRAAADAVADALVDPTVAEEISLACIRALQRASVAFMQRDDIYEYPGNLETAGRVAVDALSEMLGRKPAERLPLTREGAADVLSEVTYEDFRFEYVDAPYPRVMARGVFPDTYDPDKDFQVSQYAVVKDDLLNASFAAVMAVLEHEARETFRYRGERVFNAHHDPGEKAGLLLKPGAEPDSRRSYTADIGPSAGIRARSAPTSDS